MKRTITACLSALFLAAGVQRAPAPGPGVILVLALKCTSIGVIGATAVIIYRCEPSYYLIRVKTDEELYWLTSQASAATVRKNEGWMRCEGPFKDRSEPDFRAWCNNANPGLPMFPCGPLGTIPNATRTNYMRVTLQQQNDGGPWTSIASTTTLVGNDGSDDGWSFAVLPATGTNGMTLAQIREVQGCSAVATNTSTASAVLWRTHYEQADGVAP